MKKLAGYLLTLVIILCVGAAGFLAWRLIGTEMDYRRGQEGLEEIYQMMDEAIPAAVEAEKGEEEVPWEVRRAQYAALHEKNADMCGWIRIPGTVIDYPVMHTPEEPEYYFHRDFEGNYSSYGMIFIDGECSLDGSASNLVIYGHHMRNGSMFAGLGEYDSREFWQSHPYIYFDTLEKEGVYQVIGAFKLPGAQLDEAFKSMLLAPTREEFDELMESLKACRFYDTGEEAVWGDRLITLTTCEYTQQDGRLFVVARQIQEKGKE